MMKSQPFAGTSARSAMEYGTNEELVSNKRKPPTFKVMLLFLIPSILMVTTIFCIAYPSVFSLPTPEARNAHLSMTLDNILDGTYEAKKFNGTWISDEEILMKNTRGHIVLYNVRNQKTSVLCNDSNIGTFAASLDLSADKKYLLVAHSLRSLYRHSFVANYFILNVETQEKINLTNDKGEFLLLQLVKWSPKGNAYAYVHSNDIYYKPSVMAKEYRLTATGFNAAVYNGICDWVYEEEIFSGTSAIWFSPDGKLLAFASFNDTLTNTISIPYYGEPGNILNQYPQAMNVRYPKTGRLNPIVTLLLVSLEKIAKNDSANSIDVLPFKESMPILTGVSWITDTQISSTWMNRVQNKCRVYACDTKDKNCHMVKNFESKRGWLEYKEMLFSPDGSKMLYTDFHDQGGDDGGYNHVTIFDRAANASFPVTKGKFRVNEILAWDHSTNDVYFLATVENHPEYQHLYRANVTRLGAKDSGMECLSCKDKCNFAGAVFSKNNSYYVKTCVGPSVPTVALFDKTGTKMRMWEENVRLKKIVDNVTMPTYKYVSFDIADGMQARVKLTIPPGVDQTGKVKYPLLVYVYGGPGSDMVLDKFNVPWNTYFSISKTVIVAQIDARGSSLNEKTKFAVYRKLGTVEIEDQLNVTKQLQKKFPFLDKKRTGIWGWSYGGYATGMVLAMDGDNVFKCGASVAPVTDWIYYDTIYTERFMGLPTLQDNAQGYAESSLLNKSHKLKNKMFLLVHGSLDDNVHLQQSMLLSRALELNDIPFTQQIYPDEEHGLSGVRHHFHHLLENFFCKCFSS